MDIQSSFPVANTEPFNMAQCIREVYVLMLSSFRDRARTEEKWREIGDRQLDELTDEKVRELRNIVPQVIRAASIVLGVASIGTGLFPEAVRHSYERLSGTFPSLPSAFMQEMFRAGNDNGYSKLSKLVSGNLGTAQNAVKTGAELYDASERPHQTHLDAQIDRSKRLGDRRVRESSDRRSESTEVLRLVQQLDSQKSEAIRGLAR